MRYEGQVKARQQRELAESVIAKIEKELENPKVLDQILKQSVADVESRCLHVIDAFIANGVFRDRLSEAIDLASRDEKRRCGKSCVNRKTCDILPLAKIISAHTAHVQGCSATSLPSSTRRANETGRDDPSTCHSNVMTRVSRRYIL